MLYKLFEEVISWDYKNGFLLIFWHCLYFTATNLYPLMEYYIEWWWYGQFQLWLALIRMYGHLIYVIVWFHIFFHLNILKIICNQSIERNKNNISRQSIIYKPDLNLYFNYLYGITLCSLMYELCVIEVLILIWHKDTLCNNGRTT